MLLAGSSTLWLVGCGRAATEDDCKLIYEKNVEVEMRTLEKADEATIASKKKELQQAFDADIKQCVGKRITDAVMTCIKDAKTSEDMAKCGRK
jgi:hypothetical protein